MNADMKRGRRALFIHLHWGWTKIPILQEDEDATILHALAETHTFLSDYKGKYKVEIKRTPPYSYDGRVVIYWNDDEPHYATSWNLFKGDFWFTAFEFNFADENACRHCGGTGIDHYSGPFFHCWACDGEKVQKRETTPSGFEKVPAPVTWNSNGDPDPIFDVEVYFP